MKELPNNPILEQHLIGQSILDGRIASRDVSTSDFYSNQSRFIWSAICEIDEENHEVEPFEILKRAKGLGCNWTMQVLMQTTTGLVPDANIAKIILSLKELSLRRYLIRELSANIKLLDDTDDISSVIENLEDKFDFIRTDLSPREMGFESLATVMERDVKPALADLVTGTTNKISTGFPALDTVIGGGITLSDVILVVSDTGNGKSAFVLQLADQIAQQGIGVAYVSGEMRNKENGLRLLSRNAQTTNLNSVIRISEDDKELLDKWADHVKDRPIYFDHSSGDLQTVKANLKALIKKHKIQVLILDYIQLYKLTKNDKLKRVERLTEVSQEVKRIANELGICVIEVAQFNREGAKKEKASMHDLEGSGQLEKDTSLIFIIDSISDTGGIEIRIVKGRNSGKCALKGHFNGRVLNFEL